jgi:N-acetylglucosaminyl-diphospho-decaprenol L-rhamnosyltransferase
VANRIAGHDVDFIMSDQRITAVVINHNTREHLRRCLDALAPDAPDRTVVVDTGSGDGSAELVRSAFPRVELVEMENRGYAAGANAGLAKVGSPYALLLNADTRPWPGALRALASYLEHHSRAAVAGPLIVDERGAVEVTARRFPTPLQIFLQESGLHRFVWGKLEEKTSREVDWVLGAALALRRDAVTEVGGFDESYFMYNEEVDLCVRLRKQGWEVHYAPVATVAHVGGASTSQQRAAMAEQYVRSTTAFYRRHFSRTRQMQLKAILGAALATRRVRDRARLLVTYDPIRRRAVRSKLEAWQAAWAALRRV